MTFDDYPDEEWIEDEGDEEDVCLSCPACRETIHEDTQQCPHCGDWITPVYPHSQAKRWVSVAIILLMVLSIVILVVT